MKRKTLIIYTVALLLVLAMSGCGRLLSRDHNDIIGVTTFSEKNTVVMNSPTGDEFVSGSGKIILGEGEKLHVEYTLDKGSFDLAFHMGSDGLGVFDSADLDTLPVQGDVFGKSGVEGSGSFELDAPAGEYTVFFSIHDAAGSASVSAE